MMPTILPNNIGHKGALWFTNAENWTALIRSMGTLPPIFSAGQHNML